MNSTTRYRGRRPAVPTKPALGPDIVLSTLSVGVVAAACTGLRRAFGNSGWVGPVLVTVLASASAGFLARRAGLRPGWWLAAGALATWAASAETVLPGALQLGLPLARAVHAAQVATNAAVDQVRQGPRPVPVMPGFVLWSAWAAGLAVAGAGYLGMARRSLAALVPGFVIFCCCCALGTGPGRGPAVAALVVNMTAYWLGHQSVMGQGTFVLRTARLSPNHGSPSHGSPNHGSPNHGSPNHGAPAGRSTSRFTGALSSLGPKNLAVVGAALVGSLAVVPALGGDGYGPLGWHRSVGPGVRITPNPLVSMEGELHQGELLPAFLVQSNEASYWRLTSLSYFNGSTWQASGHYVGVSGALPRVASLPGARTVTETFDIQDLGSPWLPVAFQPLAVQGAAGVSWDAASDSLLTANPTADGQTYTVTASDDLSVLNSALLAQGSPLSASDSAALAPYLQLPDALPANIAALAQQLVGTLPTEYQKALALQDFFHRSPFTYTLAPPVGSSPSALENFLFQTHAGYCQQYAAAYAVLAREAGLPARVAVGFTTGTEVAHDVWQVDSLDAHSWPEVWFPRVGWVPFEPTPFFAVPHASQYAGPAGTGNGQNTNPAPTKSSRHRAAKDMPGASRQGSGKSGPHSRGAQEGLARWLPATAVLATAVLATAALATAALAAAGLVAWPVSLAPRSARQRRRRAYLATELARRALSRGLSAADVATALETLCLWEELCDRLSRWGSGWRPSDTATDWARRAVSRLPQDGPGAEAASHLMSLAASANAAAYGVGPWPGADVPQRRAAAARVVQVARQATPWRRRLRAWSLGLHTGPGSGAKGAQRPLHR